MNTLPPSVQKGNVLPSSHLHYVYTYAYPESMGGYIFYIGKGKGKRIDTHEHEAKMNYGKNPYKENVIRKIWANGEQVVKEKLAFFETHDAALVYEAALIFFMGPYGHLTNMTDGGEGWIPSEEIRQKISQAKKGTTPVNKGKSLTEEQKQRLREVNLGKIVSEESKRKTSESLKGRKFSEEHRSKIAKASAGRRHTAESLKKIGEASKGRRHTEETKQKIAQASSGNQNLKGHIHSEETRKKMSETHKGITHTAESKLKMSEIAKQRWERRRALQNGSAGSE